MYYPSAMTTPRTEGTDEAGTGQEAATGDGNAPTPDLGRRARAFGAVLWASFLAAAAGTRFFFAFISPDELLGGTPDNDMVDHIGVYTLGFFGLWLLSALSASLALYLRGVLEGPSRPREP
jgi:hypothetical protein